MQKKKNRKINLRTPKIIQLKNSDEVDCYMYTGASKF